MPRRFDRAQGFLLPPSLDEWLPERHLARFVVEVIDGFDLSAMVRSYRGSGSAGYHPALLLSLLVYGLRGRRGLLGHSGPPSVERHAAIYTAVGAPNWFEDAPVTGGASWGIASIPITYSKRRRDRGPRCRPSSTPFGLRPRRNVGQMAAKVTKSSYPTPTADVTSTFRAVS
jgi:hypothetical protein